MLATSAIKMGFRWHVGNGEKNVFGRINGLKVVLLLFSSGIYILLLTNMVNP
jgi:hypothetical protein